MKFTSETERLKHPLAKMISEYLWNLVFKLQITEEQMNCMQTGISTLLAEPRATLRQMHKENPEAAWCCIILGNPEANDDDLVEIANRLELSSGTHFKFAAAMGCLSLMEKILSQTSPDELEVDYCDVFDCWAIPCGHLAVLEYLEKRVPVLIEDMIKAADYAAFRIAALYGHLGILEYLEQKVPMLIENMIKAERYYAFRGAAENGYLVVLEHLEQKAPKLVNEMITAWDYLTSYGAFRAAARNGHLAVLKHLEQKAPTLIEDMIKALSYWAFRKAAENHHVMVVNHLLPYANCFAYAEMHEREYRSYVYPFFTMKLTELKARHAQLTNQNPNAVFDLTDNNEIKLCFYFLRNIIRRHDRTLDDDIYFLLQIPAVKALAHVTVTPHEPNELIRLTFMVDIEDNGSKQKIYLPFTWEAFQQLNLSFESHQRALQSYYQNKNHSAWRYLLKPNPWMHPNASYVYVDDTRTQLWSSFEEYQPLIVLLWLAAIDASRATIDNHTLEGRLDHFIDELSLIARAHNWDQTRQNEQGQLEEYDDLEGDKPSCYSGVKRRLFQSLLGHPLFTILTVDIIDQELRDFIRTHFKEKLDELIEEEKIKLRDTYQEAVIMMEEKDFIPLRTFDISPQKQLQFIETLKEKYGAALNENPGFEHRITSLLTFQEKGYPHLVIWGERVGIATIFPAEKTTNISMIQ